jgi:hypothetical protein
MLMISGLIADVNGWWGSLVFLPNLFSGITGALFGIPFALIILQRLSYRQAEDLQRRNVVRLRQAAAKELHSSALVLLRCHGFTCISVPLGDAIEVAFAAVTAVDEFPRPHEAKAFPGGFDVDGFMRCLGNARSELIKSITVLHRLLSSRAEVRNLIVDMMAKWRFLDEYVKPRIYEAGGEWLDSQTFAHLHAALYRGDFSLDALLHLREMLDDFLTTLDKIHNESRVITYDTLASGMSLPASIMRQSFADSRSCVQSIMTLHEALNLMLRQLAPPSNPTTHEPSEPARCKSGLG